MLLRSIVVMLLCASVSLGAQAAPSILIMGDSLSAGYGIASQDAWPQRLAKKLAAEGFDYRIDNVSISGDTTAGARARFAPALARSKPAIVIIALGGNDGLRGLPLKAY